MSFRFPFKLLLEKVPDQDNFKSKTHENLSNTLHDVIMNNEKGFTIGLEGNWGSGKTTTISFFRKKIAKEDSIHLYYFDAWAHEGDPLRRIFLETFINSFKRENKDLDKILNIISNRSSITKTSTTKSSTPLGLLFALSLLFVPIGLALITTIDFDILTFSWTGSIYWRFILSSTFSAFPLLVVFLNAALLKKKKLKILDSKNWPFLSQNDSQETLSEVSINEEERTSVEFDRYFKETVDILIEQCRVNKIIIILDNLDRIDVSDSLKIWSTLQTFLAGRNSNDDISNFSKIWTIIPYDTAGLKTLWDNKGEPNRKISKSFFDKSFQLRLEVPPPIFQEWESFLNDSIEEALAAWKEKDKSELTEVYKLTRKDLSDNPNPREIKTFINQVAILRNHLTEDIPVSSIAYYVVIKFLRNEEKENIIIGLINGQIPNSNELLFLHNDIKVHISSILFGVQQSDAIEVLLETPITNALSSDGEKLIELISTHGNKFWNVFNSHINRVVVLETLMEYSKNLTDLSDTIKEIKLNIYKKKLNLLVRTNSQNLGYYSDENRTRNVIYAQEFLNKNSTHLIWNKISQEISTDIPDNRVEDISKNLKAIWGSIREKKGIKLTKILWPFDKILQWSNYDNVELPLVPHERILSEYVSKIQPSTRITDEWYYLFEIIRLNPEANLSTLISPICSYIKWNNGQPSATHGFNEKLLYILFTAFNTQNEVNEEVQNLVKTGVFYNALWYNQNRNQLMAWALILIGKCSRSEISLNYDNAIGHAQSSLNSLNSLIKQDHFEELYEILLSLDTILRLEFIYKIRLYPLAKPLVNKLLALENSNKIELKTEIAQSLFTLAEDKDYFFELVNTKIDTIQPENFIENTQFYYYLMMSKDGKGLYNEIVKQISKITPEKWTFSLVNDTYLISFALKIKKENTHYFVSHYSLGFLSFIEETIDELNHNLTDWQSNNWNKLVALITKEHYSSLKAMLEQALIKHKFFCNKSILGHLITVFSKQEISKILSKHRDSFQDTLIDALKTENNTKIDTINILLERSSGVWFKVYFGFKKNVKSIIEDSSKNFSSSLEIHRLKKLLKIIN